MNTTRKPTRLREPFLSIVNAVNERDRDYFRKHPNEKADLRKYIPGEHDPQVFRDLGVIPPGLDDCVLVHNLAPGIRSRQPIGRLTGPRPFPRRLSVLLPDGSVVEDVPVYAGEAS